MKKQVIIDFDHTLLDTRALEGAMVESLAPFGISYAQWRAAYVATLHRTPGSYDFTAPAFAATIGTLHPELASARAAIESAIGSTLDVVPDLLFFGATDLLEATRPHVDDFVLLTRGNREWQEAKVESSGIAGMFDRCVYVTEQKADVLRDVIDVGGRTAFVNDNPEENVLVRDRFPSVVMIHVDGPHGTPESLEDVRVDGIDGVRVALSDFLDVPL